MNRRVSFAPSAALEEIKEYETVAQEWQTPSPVSLASGRGGSTAKSPMSSGANGGTAGGASPGLSAGMAQWLQQYNSAGGSPNTSVDSCESDVWGVHLGGGGDGRAIIDLDESLAEPEHTTTFTGLGGGDTSAVNLEEAYQLLADNGVGGDVSPPRGMKAAAAAAAAPTPSAGAGAGAGEGVSGDEGELTMELTGAYGTILRATNESTELTSVGSVAAASPRTTLASSISTTGGGYMPVSSSATTTATTTASTGLTSAAAVAAVSGGESEPTVSMNLTEARGAILAVNRENFHNETGDSEAADSSIGLDAALAEVEMAIRGVNNSTEGTRRNRHNDTFDVTATSLDMEQTEVHGAPIVVNSAGEWGACCVVSTRTHTFASLFVAIWVR